MDEDEGSGWGIWYIIFSLWFVFWAVGEMTEPSMYEYYDNQYDYDYAYGYNNYDPNYVDNSITYEKDVILCSENVYNCGSFNTYTEAKRVYDKCGGVTNDVHHLDGDGDGRPCEELLYK